MGLHYITAAAWIVGMLFGPDNLVLLGQSAGSNGVGLIFLLFFAMMAYIAHSRCYKNIRTFRPGAGGEFEWIAHSIGPAAAVIFSIAPRILTAVFLATAALVAAGFVFNEVFVQRFPNFAFAFLMLGALLALNLYRREISDKIQILLSATAVIGVFFLAAAGIFEWLKTCEIVYTVTLFPSLRESFSVLLVFVGFDLLLFLPNNSAKYPSAFQRYWVVGIVIAGIVFCFWGVASFLYVPTEKLAGTFIPHILAAKNILGQAGRYIMGLVIIAGAGAAVNVLFKAVGGMVTDLGRNESLPFMSRFFSRSPITLILLSLVTAIMMALGVAGTDELDTYIRGSLILWLLNYAVIHLTFLLGGDQRSLKENEPLSRRQTISHGAISLLMLAGSGILIATDENVGLLVRYLSIIFFGVGLPAWLVGKGRSRHRTHHVPDVK